VKQPDEELRKIEDTLRQWRPSAPPKHVAGKIAQDLEGVLPKESGGSGSQSNRGSVPFLLWAGPLLAAACLVLGFMLLWRPGPLERPGNAGKSLSEAGPENGLLVGGTPPDAPANPDYKPVKAENVLKSVSADGIVMGRDNQPMRRFRYEFIDTITWKNAQDGSSIRMSYPREEIVLVPVRTL